MFSCNVICIRYLFQHQISQKKKRDSMPYISCFDRLKGKICIEKMGHSRPKRTGIPGKARKIQY